MPRSPLMRQVRPALRLSLAAQRAHLDDDHVLELRGQHFQHRRMLVRAGASSGAALGLVACGVSPGTPAAAGGNLQTLGVQHNASPVVIVGAGIAGLTAGYRLRQAGVKVSIYEASARVGGRMLSLPNALGIKTAELGGEFIDSGHVHIRHLAAELGLSARVRFTGLVDHALVPAAVAAFDIALQPKVVPYASPLKIFDYMAAGRAIVAPDQPNIREVLQHGRTALLFDSADPAALWAAIRRLANAPALRRQLGTAARAELVERDYTWSGNARRITAWAAGQP